jgi:hypothetical protein
MPDGTGLDAAALRDHPKQELVIPLPQSRMDPRAALLPTAIR